MTNLPAQLSTLQDEIFILTEKLEPINDDRISKCIRSLLSAGMALPVGMLVDKAPEIYNFALSGIGIHGVTKATEKLIRGEYEMNRSFIPRPPEFAAIARAEAQKIVDDVARARAKKTALEDVAKLREKSTPQQLQRIRQLHDEFKRAHAATKLDRRGNGAPPC